MLLRQEEGGRERGKRKGKVQGMGVPGLEREIMQY